MKRTPKLSTERRRVGGLSILTDTSLHTEPGLDSTSEKHLTSWHLVPVHGFCPRVLSAQLCARTTSTRVALHYVGRLAASHTWETGSSLPAVGDHYMGCTKCRDLPHDTSEILPVCISVSHLPPLPSGRSDNLQLPSFRRQRIYYTVFQSRLTHLRSFHIDSLDNLV